MSSNISGKVIAIKGGARGIGFDTAKRLVADGARVAIGDIDEVQMKEAVTELDITAYARLDVTDPASFAEFLDMVESELGPIDVLVNNAGIMPTGWSSGSSFSKAIRTCKSWIRCGSGRT